MLSAAKHLNVNYREIIVMLNEVKHLDEIAWIPSEMLHSVQHDIAFIIDSLLSMHHQWQALLVHLMPTQTTYNSFRLIVALSLLIALLAGAPAPAHAAGAVLCSSAEISRVPGTQASTS